jgi:iron complex transport system substrate-binding protein
MNPEFKPQTSDTGGGQKFAAILIASILVLSCVAALTWWVAPPAPRSSQSQIEQMGDQTPAGATGPAEPTVATLAPAATDLVIGIGAGEHIVAVSDWDEDRPGAQDMPHVGDFDHVDWEKIAAVSPKILITQFGDRMPVGLKEQSERLKIQLVDVHLDVIEDVYREADRLGELLNEQNIERGAVNELKQRLATIAKKSQGMEPVRTAIVMSDGSSVALIGPNTFHDELLTIAGGVNVAAKLGKTYVNVDREQLLALAPDVVLDLEPDTATTPQELRQTARYWASLPDLPAVQNHRVKTITESYCRRPGWRLADLAERFFEELHGSK